MRLSLKESNMTGGESFGTPSTNPRKNGGFSSSSMRLCYPLHPWVISIRFPAAALRLTLSGYFIKYLDQQNINSAFVSGMKEDLGLYGDELNIMQSCWTVGYVIGQLPSNIILTKFRPSLWIPTMEVLWTVLTFCLSRCSTAKQIYALRFFIGKISEALPASQRAR